MQLGEGFDDDDDDDENLTSCQWPSTSSTGKIKKESLKKKKKFKGWVTMIF